MIFEPLRQAGVFLPAGSTPLWVAGNCGERAGGPLCALVAFFFHAKTKPPGMVTGGLALAECYG